MRREGMDAVDDIFGLFDRGERLCRSTFDVGISSKLNQILSARGTSKSENRDTKETMSPNFSCQDKNRHYFAMSPTCRRHVANITSQDRH